MIANVRNLYQHELDVKTIYKIKKASYIQESDQRQELKLLKRTARE